MSKRLIYLLCMALACAVFVAACGETMTAAAAAAAPETGATEGAKAIDPASMENAKGDVTVCMGKDTARRHHDRREGVQRPEQRRHGQPARVLDLGRRAAHAVRPAPGGEVGRVRRVLVRRDLDRGVRVPEVALRHDAVRREPQGRADRGDARDRHLRRQVLGHAAADRRGVPVLPHRPGQGAAGHLAGGLRGRGPERRHRLPGRAVRGPDLRLPRAGVRGRRPGAVRGRQDSR